MGDAAEKPDVVEVSTEDIRRLVTALESTARSLALITQYEERRLAQAEDASRRAMRKAGPTTEQARANVQRVHRKLGI